MTISEIIKKQLEPKEILNSFVIIAILATTSFVSWQYGWHDGQIQQCNDMGKYKLSDGSCVDKMLVDWQLEQRKDEGNNNFITYKNALEMNIDNIDFEVKNASTN